MQVRFSMPLIAVRDIERSKRFYAALFDQQVTFDFGENVQLSGGIALQQDFGALTGLPPASVQYRTHNMELYFEVDDFPAFLQRLEAYGGVEYVHPPLKHDWEQHVVRIYDPDGHIIEVGEDMRAVARRLLREGHSVEETARITQHPVEFIRQAMEA